MNFKFVLMSSLLVCGGAGLCHHTINTKETVTTNISTYTVSIPSEININTEGETSSFSVTGELLEQPQPTSSDGDSGKPAAF